MRVAVLGSGPMGLMGALELHKRGCEVDVFEGTDRIGGMSASFDFAGTHIERFYHFICRTDAPLLALLTELGIDDRLRWVDTKMGFYCEGKLYPWGTPRALIEFDRLNWVEKIRYAFMVMYTKNITDWRPLDRIDAVTWLKGWLGNRAYRTLWERLLELKLHAHADHLSAAWLAARIKRIALSRRNLFQESLGFLDGGSDTLLERMRNRAEAIGVRFHLNAQVSRVLTHVGRVRGVVANGTEFAFDKVVSTIPIRYVPLLLPELPPEFKEQINAIENIPVVCVILKLTRPISEYFWMNICDPRMEIPGIIEYSNLNSGDGAAIVYAPFYMPKTNAKFARPDSAFIDEVLDCLPLLNPAFRRDWLLAAACHRYEYAQAISPPRFFEQLPRMASPIAGFYMADTCYYYPEDRSMSESVRIGSELARLVTTE